MVLTFPDVSTKRLSVFDSCVSDPLAVVLDEDIEVPAKHEVLQTARVRNPTISESVLEPNMDLSGRGVLVARVVVQPKGQRVPIQIINPGTEPVKSYKGIKVGSLQHVDDVEMSDPIFAPEDSPKDVRFQLDHLQPEQKTKMEHLLNSYHDFCDGFRRICLLVTEQYLPIGHRVIYYKCFLQPHINYCCTVSGKSSHIIRIHKLQKLALRIIYDKPKLTSSGPLFKAAGVLPIQQRVMLRTAIMVYKSLNNWVPKYISDMFVLKSSVALQWQRITRSSENNELWIPRTKLTIRQKTLKYSGAILYNSLPLATKQSTSLSSFKLRAYQYFLDTNI